VLGDQHVGDQTGEPAQQAPVVVIDGVQGESHHPYLVAAVQQGHIHANATGMGDLDRGHPQEGRAGRGVADRLGLTDKQSSPRQRHQQFLRVVLQEDRDVASTDLRHFFRDQRSDQPRRHLVCPIQQHSEQPLTESFRPVHQAPVGPPLTPLHGRPLLA
jgi:hypothetical protein